MNQGMVYLVGAGPGDPELITCKGRSCLRKAQVVVYDHLASEELLKEADPKARRIYVGKQAGHHSMKQEEINALLTAEALAGNRVVRLKGGDPFVFGRGGEEIEALKEAGIPWELVPGVTSAVAVPECAGIPVTHRGVSRSFHVITAHPKEGDSQGLNYQELAAMSGTLVFLMGLGRLSRLCSGLIQAGKDPQLPAAVIEKGSLPGQRVVRGCLKDIAEKVQEAALETPAVIVVGETAAMDLLCSRSGRIQVGVAGTDSFCRRMKECLQDFGIAARLCGGLRIISRMAAGEKAWFSSLNQYSWIAFTSANGVRLFFDSLMEEGMDSRALAGLKVAVLGPGTAAALKGYGLRADGMPEAYSAEALARLLADICGPQDRILIPRSAQGSREVNRILDQAGIAYDDVPIYDTEALEVSPDQLKGLDYMIFGSAGGVRGFFETDKEEMRAALEQVKIGAIGPWTAAALEQMGCKVSLQPEVHTALEMAKAVFLDQSFVNCKE